MARPLRDRLRLTPEAEAKILRKRYNGRGSNTVPRDLAFYLDVVHHGFPIPEMAKRYGIKNGSLTLDKVETFILRWGKDDERTAAEAPSLPGVGNGQIRPGEERTAEKSGL